MKFDLKRPCPNCPFRHDVPGFLRQERAEEIAGALEQGHTFACHQTTEFEEDDDGESYHCPTAKEQHCAGALIMLEHMDILGHSQLARIAMRMGWFNPDELDMEAPVHQSFEDFIEHHDD